MLHNIERGDGLFLKIGFLDNGLGEKCSSNIIIKTIRHSLLSVYSGKKYVGITDKSFYKNIFLYCFV